jgi:hypothetical protein
MLFLVDIKTPAPAGVLFLPSPTLIKAQPMEHYAAIKNRPSRMICS